VFVFIRIHSSAQAPIHEASLLERHPPLAWFARSIRVQFLDEPSSEFLADLHQILAKVVCICTTRGWRIVRIQKEVGIAGDGEVIDRERVERFVCFYLSRRGARTAKLRKTIRNEEDEDDQEAIARSLDLKVSEKRVGAEEVEGFVDDVSLLDHSCERGGTAQPGFDGVNPKVAHLPDIWFLVKSRMIRGHEW